MGIDKLSGFKPYRNVATAIPNDSGRIMSVPIRPIAMYVESRNMRSPKVPERIAPKNV